jgi:hypothetical protein
MSQLGQPRSYPNFRSFGGVEIFSGSVEVLDRVDVAELRVICVT